MTDKELLELAAKAAGYDISHPWNRRRKEMGNSHVGLFVKDISTNWNPEENSGHALKLAVDMGFDIAHGWSIFPEATAVAVVTVMLDGKQLAEVPLEGDPLAATRRAIFLAAVSIGRSM